MVGKALKAKSGGWLEIVFRPNFQNSLKNMSNLKGSLCTFLLLFDLGLVRLGPTFGPQPFQFPNVAADVYFHHRWVSNKQPNSKGPQFCAICQIVAFDAIYDCFVVFEDVCILILAGILEDDPSLAGCSIIT